MRLYLASPFGFSESGRYFYSEVLLPLIRQTGHDAIDPWALTPPRLLAEVEAMPHGPAQSARRRELNLLVGLNNANGIDASDGLLAILDGSDVDSGTASEIGYAFARQKRILGYRSDFRRAGDNADATVNIQVEYFIIASGGALYATLASLRTALGDLSISE